MSAIPTDRSRCARALACAALVACALARGADAHDFWIMPSSFRPEAGARVAIDLRVGERFVGDPVARNPDRLEQFVARKPDGAQDAIAGVEGRAPAGYWRASPGLAWIGYKSRPASLELAAEKFERYLADEGLERVIERRKARGETAKVGREIYSRCAKSLVRVGPASEADARVAAQKLGFPLEILVLRNPCDLVSGDELEIALTYSGEPLEGALVGCMSASDPQGEVRLRTDARGRAKFTLAKGGAWLVRAVHMVEAPAGASADWESTWASLTFELR